MTTENLTWDQAVLRVLEEARIPLHYTDVGSRVAQQQLTKSVGANPAAGAMTTLRTLVKGKRVVQTERGVYALPEVAHDVAVAEAAAEDEANVGDRLIVNAYGLYWSRSLVNWDPPATNSQAKLLGDAGAGLVNFADQDGIYLLHSGSEIMYVGQSYTPQNGTAGLYNRLRNHHNDNRKSDRWDAFSWFGFRPVSDELTLGPTPENATTKDVIDLIEGILIEGIMPRLNMRRGEGSKAWEPNLYYQIEDPNLIVKKLSALGTLGQTLRE